MRRKEDWDDGRTVADMSGVTRPSLLGTAKNPPSEEVPERLLEEYTPKERRWAILGALRATLLIALAYLAGLALVIFLLLRLWK